MMKRNVYLLTTDILTQCIYVGGVCVHEYNNIMLLQTAFSDADLWSSVAEYRIVPLTL